ncbi:MAG: tRNA 5-methoxyuridine(34)/uridine 5-oxyacetic acid(34) synthase CmoB [Porticoccus sp.]|jgi:tRNA (mo5U34)-methyltransferase
MNLPEQSIINFSGVINEISKGPLSSWAKILPEQIEKIMSAERWGDIPTWELAIKNLPQIVPSMVDLKNGVLIGGPNDCDGETLACLKTQLMGLHPWRKGPFYLCGLDIDTEWRSDWKWNRVLPHISPLEGRLVLDVGCGNGYHCLRMRGEGAKRVIGIDPSVKFVYQFYAIKHFINQAMNQKKPAAELSVDVLPVGIEHMPAELKFFDTVFSMGVLYHRRSPINHLSELGNLARPGGQVVIETLIIDGGVGDVLAPKGRYAKMANIWSLPSSATMLSWMKQCQFKNARVVDISTTTPQEQRSSDWMQFESLVNFLDPDNPKLTIEGHPAPMRAIFIAEI